MKKDIKEDWIEALRSGEFVQGRGALDRNGRQCCLGVLCDILDLEWKDTFGPGRLYGNSLFGYAAGVMPVEERVRAGLTMDNERDVIRLNDRYKASFDEIADWIEVYL